MSRNTKKKENEGGMNACPLFLSHRKWLLFSSERVALISQVLRQRLWLVLGLHAAPAVLCPQTRGHLCLRCQTLSNISPHVLLHMLHLSATYAAECCLVSFANILTKPQLGKQMVGFFFPLNSDFRNPT